MTMTDPDDRALTALVEQAHVGLCVVRSGRLTYANPRLAALFGYTLDELLELADVTRLVDPPDRRALAALMAPGGASGAFVPARGVTKGGDLVDLEVHATPFHSPDGSPSVAATFLDVSDRRQTDAARRALANELDAAQRQLTEIGHTDNLTGLPNRAGFERLLRAETKRALRNGSWLSAVLVDCDGLRRVNETFGQAVGDLALVEVGQRVASAVRGSDQVARLGGDEFMAVLPDTGIWQAEEVAQRICLQVGSSPILRAPETVSLSVTTAALQLGPDSSTIEEVWSRGAMAVRQRRLSDAGSIGPLASTFTEAQVSQRALEQLSRLESIVPYRQPIANLNDRSVWGYELLTRTVVRNFELPGDFLRLAQEHSILTLVDLLCLRAAVRSAAAGAPAARYHLNLFPSTILNTPTQDIIDILRRLPDAGPHCIELSEQQFFGDSRQLTGRLGELRQAGYEIALDDVGFGRTSLELLILLEPELVKIDRRFVAGIGHDVLQRSAFRRLLDIVEACGARAAAEGLEDDDDLRAAQDLGATLGQGYILGRPAPFPAP